MSLRMLKSDRPLSVYQDGEAIYQSQDPDEAFYLLPDGRSVIAGDSDANLRVLELNGSVRQMNPAEVESWTSRRVLLSDSE